MRRIRDQFLPNLEEVLTLRGRTIVEVGSGDGERSSAIAARCRRLHGLEPDREKVMLAQRRRIPNAEFTIANALALASLPKHRADVVLFTLSLHHVYPAHMPKAIDGAVHAVRPEGYVVFFEPGFAGSVFDAEKMFGAWDDDETKAKQWAREAIESHAGIEHVRTLNDVTEFAVESVDDFVRSMRPKRNLAEIAAFLNRRDHKLMAHRVTTICRPKQAA